MNPKVTVLMSIYNGEKYLQEAVESILAQTFTEFEFIIINDASTDNSRTIIENYTDPRIVLLNNDYNQGLAKSLNRGLEIAKGKYIVRMDADDISLPERLAVQVDFMENHPETGLCGTWIRTIGNKPEVEIHFTCDAQILRCNLLFNPQIVHPSVIMRREPLLQYGLFYNTAYPKAQDFELWRRCSRYFALANIDKVLLLYRRHDEQVTSNAYDTQQQYSGLVRLEELENMGIQPDENEFQLHQTICMSKYESNRSFIEKTCRWFNKLKNANINSNYYPEPAFSDFIDRVFLNICRQCKFAASEFI